MTETTKTIFEKYQVRKTNKQKKAFREYLSSVAEKDGYVCHTEKGYLGARNLVVGDVKNAKVIYTAHYDTCPRLFFPNFITPKNFLIYLLYQLLIVAFFLIIYYSLFFFSTAVLMHLAFDPYGIIYTLVTLIPLAVLWLLIFLLLAGPANKHTANDNTSGVTTLIDTMLSLPEEYRDKTAFVFFDLEEVGLFGSAGFASKHKTELKDKLVVNFDCVSDGENILIVLNKRSKRFEREIKEAFIGKDGISVEVLSRGVFYPSDQMNFPHGVGVAALKRSKTFKILYMDKIHTSKDTVYREENIEFLVHGSAELLRILCEDKSA